MTAQHALPCVAMHEPFAMPCTVVQKLNLHASCMRALFADYCHLIPAGCQQVLMEELRPCNERMNERRILAGWLGPYNTSPLTGSVMTIVPAAQPTLCRV